MLLGFTAVTQAQDKIIFDYDDAGNQVNRELCISPSCTKTGYKTAAPTNPTAEKEAEKLEKFFPEDVISYYPNPVKEELFLKWELVEGKNVQAIMLYNSRGQAIQNFGNLQKNNSLNIPFLSYPTGTYLIVLLYNDGDPKTIKIVK